MKKKFPVRELVFAGVLAALSMVLSLYPFTFYLTDSIRVTFREVPILLCAFLLGPWYAAGCAFAADLIGTLVTGLGWYPPLTVPAVLFAILAGVLAKLLESRLRPLFRISVSTIVANLFCPILLTTAILSHLYGTPYGALIAVRGPLYACLLTIQIILVRFLLPPLTKLFQMEKRA